MDTRMAIQRFFAIGDGIVCPETSVSILCKEMKTDGALIVDDDSLMCTWKALGSEFVTVIKINDEATAILFHYSMELFLASIHCSLSIDCPVGSSFIGQIILDNGVNNQKVPVLMVFDVITYGGNGMSNVDPIDRYRILRESCHQFFIGESVRIQWVGHGNAAIQFCQDNSDCLPHLIDYVFYLPACVTDYKIGRYLA